MSDTMIVRWLFLRCGAHFLWFGLKTIIFGAASPRWAQRNGYTIKETDGGFSMEYAVDMHVKASAAENPLTD